MHWTDTAEVYHPREPRSSPLWSVLQKHFSEFLLKYDDSYVREFGDLRSIVPEVVQGGQVGHSILSSSPEKPINLPEVPTRVEIINVTDYRPKNIPFSQWRECIKKVWEVDPLSFPKCAAKQMPLGCGSEMKRISVINEGVVIRKILEYLRLREDKTPLERASPDLISEKNYEPYENGRSLP